jgi:hypothetical protein
VLAFCLAHTNAVISRVSEDKFIDIRPYYDNEVRAVLDRILSNDECISAVSKLRFPKMSGMFPWIFNPLVSIFLSRQLGKVNTVDGFQNVVEHYMSHMIKSTTSSFTVSGLDTLAPSQPFLYMSNHRDISLDPAFVNYALYHNGHSTVRIAIGDNLLTKDYVSDLMRLNKSFIVNRSAKGPRQILAAYRKLSAYIRFSIVDEEHPVWMAQREGRAKDGIDRTEPAIIKMLCMSQSKGQSLSEAVRELRIVPTAISYEYDPCDVAKAKELYHKAKDGAYEKGEQEDIESIATGIAGAKGAIDVNFGSVLDGEYENADAVATAMDDQIIKNYILHPSNFFAYEMLHGKMPEGVHSAKNMPFVAGEHQSKRKEFEMRLMQCPQEYRAYFLANYANAIVSKQERGLM